MLSDDRCKVEVMAPTHILVVRTPNRQVLRLLLTEPIEFGRDGDGLNLSDPLMSRRHARFEPGGEGVTLVCDLGSSNGTTVDGMPTVGVTPVRVGNVVAMGNTRVEIAQLGGEVATAVGVTELLRNRPREDVTSMGRVVQSVSSDLAPTLAGVGITDEADTLTIVFSDIEGSTERAVALGDGEWFAILGKHNRLVTDEVRRHRGRIIKNQGDGFMMCFRSARAALLCAIGIQRALADWAQKQPIDAVRVRIGMHTGEVMVDDGGDIFGKHVVTAARVGAAASGGQILVSGLVRQIAQPRGDISFGPPMELELKGLPEAQIVHTVEWIGYKAPT